MKIICSKAELLKGVNTVQRAVPSHTTMSVLTCILIDASAGKITLTANNMELGIETAIDGIIEERGIIALEARFFSEIVRKLPDNDVTISTQDSLMTTITCESAKFSIIGKEASELTRLPYVEKNTAVTISQFALKEVIRQTLFAAAVNETNNKVLTGVLFDICEDRLQVVALDGHRVALRNLKLHHNYEENKVIIPGKTLSEIGRILTGEADELTDMYFTEELALFEMGDTSVVSRLVEGRYFQIEHFISNNYETKISVNKRILMDCIDRSSLFASEADKRPLIVEIYDDHMDLKIRSMIGSMNEQVPVIKEGKEFRIAFNPKFFGDALRAIDEEEITLYMINEKAPCFIRDQEESYVYMVLPVNFNESDYA